MEKLLDVHNLKKYFAVKKGLLSRVQGYVKAVDDVSLFIHPGETLGLVGESGCGKTTLGRCILRLIEPDSGRIIFDGEDLLKLNPAELRKKRRDIQIIFQDPYASLNPRMTIGKTISEGLVIHKLLPRKERESRVRELLEIVGLDGNHYNRFPHEFSGGQRQRIGVARALALNPKLIVCDEPVSALDVSIQAQVINLLQDLQEQYNLTYLFIAHDLALVKYFSNRIAVMYLGKIVEIAESHEMYEHPLHPYTRALLSAVPIPDPTVRKKREILEGDVPTPLNPPEGCSFHTRCPIGKTKKRCREETPVLKAVEKNHWVACHFSGE